MSTTRRLEARARTWYLSTELPMAVSSLALALQNGITWDPPETHWRYLQKELQEQVDRRARP